MGVSETPDKREYSEQGHGRARPTAQMPVSVKVVLGFKRKMQLTSSMSTGVHAIPIYSSPVSALLHRTEKKSENLIYKTN